jgi:molecular chaperone DnaK
MNFKRLIQSLIRSLRKLLEKLQGSKDSHQKLAKTCKLLQQDLASSGSKNRAGETYSKALKLASQCGIDELIQVIGQFDASVGEINPDLDRSFDNIISILLENRNQTISSLDAAWKLTQRLHTPATIDKTQHQICLKIAQVGESNSLLGKLLKIHNERGLISANLTQILKAFLERNSFDSTVPWKPFFQQLQASELPSIHQIYALLDRYQTAAELAEADGDFRDAIGYLASVPGKQAAIHALDLANQLKDKPTIVLAHQRVAESYWQEDNYAEALGHFQQAGNLERMSNCHQKLGQLGLAIQFQPSTELKWRQEIRSAMETVIDTYLTQQDYLPALELLKTVADAWRQKSPAAELQAEADRTQRLLAEVVKIVRLAFNTELRSLGDTPGTDIFKRWSRLEAAAGNYLEAAIQAKKAEDYFGAALLFEEAGAFGEAISALDVADPNAENPLKKAQILEQGGDFFMAGLLYEELNEIDLAIDMYDRLTDFTRAANLRQHQIGEAQSVFDDRFRDLLVKAGRAEQLAELCAERANDPSQTSEQKSRLWRRIKELVEQGLVGQKWTDLVATELPGIESFDRDRFTQQAPKWVQSACRAVLAEYSDAIGLDLGTSNSVVCLYNKQLGKPEVVEINGKRQIPSVFAIDRLGQELVGVAIADLLLKSPRAIVTKAKREMGTDRKFRAGGQDYRPEEISARIINHARNFARQYLQRKIAIQVATIADRSMGSTPPTDWVEEFLAQHPPLIPLTHITITVPAYFNEAQKQATKTAGVLANINVLRLIHEPTAACLAQRIHQDKTETILVADLGAGTFDLSIVEIGDGVFEVLEIEGDNALGSADVDELIYTHFSEFAKAETGAEIPHNGQAATRLRQACEELKIELSSQSEWTIDLPALIADRSIRLTLTRAELERLAAAWLERIRLTCQKINHKPDRVLLIGGGGLMPAARECIRSVFKREPDAAYDPLTVVARGAALQSAILLGDAKQILLLDATPFSLGIRCQTESGSFKFDPIIPKHTTTPSDQTRQYTTANDGQTEVNIEIFQGESSIPEENFKIGQFSLQGIPPTTAGIPKIDVKFDIDLNCLLTVTARDAVTGNQQSITINDSHLLTPAQASALSVKFQTSQAQQLAIARLEQLAIDLNVKLAEIENIDLSNLSIRLQTKIQTYERYRSRYAPTRWDNDKLFEIYRDRQEVEDKSILAIDRWGTLNRSVRMWLDAHQQLDRRAPTIQAQVEELVTEGDLLRRRASEAGVETAIVATTYQKWLNTIENLPIDPDGSAPELAKHFLSLNRYAEALAQFERIEQPLAIEQVELGLEIQARSRQRVAYTAMLLEYAQSLELHSPDFERLNHSVRIYTESIIWIQIAINGVAFSGSGFAISPNLIATNRHVVINDATGACIAPEYLQVISDRGSLQVTAIHLPSWGADDVAILQVQSAAIPLLPLRLGFSELVEVGERIMTIGFPAPESGGFQENLYCNTGLVNRIRSSQFCTERVLEVSIPLQGGISGAPILNQFGEVIGLLTFYTERQQTSLTGQAIYQQSFYAIPVELLRRLRAEIQLDDL